MVLAVGGYHKHGTPSQVETFNGQSWITVSSANVLYDGYKFAMCVIGEELYVTGGGCPSSDRPYSSVKKFNPVRDTWSSVTPMPDTRFGHQACAVDGILYVFGGSQLQTWKYDPKTSVWNDDAMPLPTPSMFAASAVVGQNIYLFGGCSTDPHANVYRYNVLNNTWLQLSPMPTARMMHYACVLHGWVYITGGWETKTVELDTVLRYNPSSDTWKYVSPMSVPRSAHSGFVLNGSMYIVGGSNHIHGAQYAATYNHRIEDLTSVEKYDPVHDTWSNVADLNIGRRFFNAAAWKVEERGLDRMIRDAKKQSWIRNVVEC